MTKTTPPNCKLSICPWNVLPPHENSQECIACDGNKRPNWHPTGRRPKAEAMTLQKAIEILTHADREFHMFWAPPVKQAVDLAITALQEKLEREKGVPQ